MKRLFFYVIAVLLLSCHLQKAQPSFNFEGSEQGIRLLENGQPVFFYQRMPKSLDGQYVCNNYLHPLYSLNGDTLTEEFPSDHPYHRGIFWAWHQIYRNGESIGDGWTMKNIEQEVADIQTDAENHAAQLRVHILWKSPLFDGGKPFINEHTAIKVYPLRNGLRMIDFTIALKALVPGIEIGGSDDEKGYGGLCARLKLPEDITFTSAGGPVVPRTLQINAGAWMDFSGSFSGVAASGVSILCHPETPNYPAPWILRSKKSMQNIVFPGRNQIEIPVDKPLTLFYRLIINNGNLRSVELKKLQDEYERTEVTKTLY